MAFPELKTDRLLLKQFQADDLENVYRGLSDPAVIKYYGISFQSLEETNEQMRWFKELEAKGSGIWWALWSHDKTTFYGGGGFNNLSREHRKAEIGFWLLPEYWGLGLMQEAMPAIINYGFHQLRLHRIEGFVESDNINCKRAISKLGFTHEGCMQDCEQKNGRYISVDIFAKIRQD